jgi:photosystem II stability/assembly factor-like uncharacterized protein
MKINLEYPKKKTCQNSPFLILALISSKGYSVGYFGEIWHTKDGGEAWIIQNSGLRKALI